jgi:membrane-bound lytic murein transglycosylase A
MLAMAVTVAAACNISGLPAKGRAPIEHLTEEAQADALRLAIRRSRTYLQKLAPESVVGEQPRRVTAREILDSLAEFERLLDLWPCRECWQREFTARFDLVPSSPDPAAAAVLFTGYYQPVIEASLVPTPEYRYPIYGKPPDLIVAEEVSLEPLLHTRKVIGRYDGEKFVPYYSRREIDRDGVLSARGYEIAWVKNPVDLFFMHIQGSGVLQLADGRRLQVGYAGQNGRVYRSIGRLLIDSGQIPAEDMSMQRLRRYLAENPSEQYEIMAHNESYIFFRFLEDGPLGTLEVPVTPERSIATDLRIFPRGALVLAVTETPVLGPDGELRDWRPFARFVLNQDSGGAIRGAQRADLYFGTGAEAGSLAGYMNREGRLYFVMMKGRAVSGGGERSTSPGDAQSADRSSAGERETDGTP